MCASCALAAATLAPVSPEKLAPASPFRVVAQADICAIVAPAASAQALPEPCRKPGILVTLA